MTIFFEMFKWVFSWWGKLWSTKMKKNTVKKAFQDASKIYGILEGVLERVPDSVRVLVIYTSNGGGIPKAGTALYATVLFEDRLPSVDPVREAWQNRPVLSDYVKMLCELETQHALKTTTGKPKKDTVRVPQQIDTLFKEKEIEGTYLCKIGETEGRYYYLSVNVKKLAKEIPSVVFDSAHQIKEIIEQS